MNPYPTEVNKKEFFPLIEEDRYTNLPSYNRYPIRFILLSSFKDLREIVKLLIKKADIFELTESNVFKNNSDSWLTVTSIINNIKNLDQKRSFIIPSISEFARFLANDEFLSLFSSFMDIENPEQYFYRRIYIPLVGINQKFMLTFWDRYHRRSEFIPIWKVIGNTEKYSLYFVNFNLESHPSFLTIISSSKDFLNLWKEEDLSERIICTSNILNYYSNKIVGDELFNIVRVDNIRDYLSEIYKFKVPFSYNVQEERFWKCLINEITNSKASNFFEFTEDYFNIKKLDEENILSLWFRYDTEFHRWLIKNYFDYKLAKRNTYINKVLSSTNTYDNIDILKNYYLKIFEEKPNPKLIEERRRVIKEFVRERSLDLSFIDEYLKNKIESLEPKEALHYITCTTLYEKEWTIKNIDIIKNLEELYPELNYYLRDISYSNLKTDQLWIKEYFKEYRTSRIKNSPTERLLNILNEKNASSSTFYKWYYSFGKVEDFLKEGFERIWIDALSLEFLPFIVNLLTAKGFYVDFNIAVAKLPTSTEFNKLEDVDRLSELDDFIHSQSIYKYPEDLIRELEIIEKIIKKIISLKDRFLIFSDHGFTSFANRKFQEGRLPLIKVSEREGRYGVLDGDISIFSDSDEDYIIYQREELEKNERYLIALRYDSFSYLSSPETHGGATPEETLVPIIYASKIPLEEVFYEVKLLNDVLTVRDPVLNFSVYPRPKTSIMVKSENKELAVFSSIEDIYKLNLSKLKPGEYILTFTIGNFKIDKNVIIKGGSIERDLL